MLNRTPLKTATAAVFATLLMVPALANADPPDGIYIFALQDLRVVDGDTDFSQFFPFAFLCNKFKTKSSGKLTGKCNLDVPGQSGLDGKIKGDINHTKKKTTLCQSIRLDGKTRAGGRNFDIEYNIDTKSTLKKDAEMIKVKTKVEICAEGFGCEKDSNTTKISAASFDNLGVIVTNAVLELDVTTNAKNKIKGTGTITTTEGKKIKLKAKGKHTLGGTSIIKLSKGKTSVRLEDADVVGDVMTTLMTYKKVFGNADSFPAMSEAPAL